MEKKTTYHEQKDVENILRLREVLSTLRRLQDYFVRSIRRLRPRPGFPMPTISGFSFSFFLMKIGI